MPKAILQTNAVVTTSVVTEFDAEVSLNQSQKEVADSRLVVVNHPAGLVGFIFLSWVKKRFHADSNLGINIYHFDKIPILSLPVYKAAENGATWGLLALKIN